MRAITILVRLLGETERRPVLNRPVTFRTGLPPAGTKYPAKLSRRSMRWTQTSCCQVLDGDPGSPTPSRPRSTSPTMPSRTGLVIVARFASRGVSRKGRVEERATCWPLRWPTRLLALADPPFQEAWLVLPNSVSRGVEAGRPTERTDRSRRIRPQEYASSKLCRYESI